MNPSESTSDDAEARRRVMSPFAGVESAAAPRNESGRRTRLGAWIWGLCAAILLACVGGYFLLGHLNDPMRTLETFPVGKYLESHRGLMGSKFKGDLRVEADLGWKAGVGRLMLFSGPSDARPVAVLIPESVAGGIYFSKGQSYLAELEVKEGGLIQANSVRKN